MVAPPSPLERFLLKKSSDMADAELKKLELKKKQLLAANKQRARILLLGVSSDSYITVTKNENWNIK